MSDNDEELFLLQQTLYESQNPTRRWLHRSRHDWIFAAIRRWGLDSERAMEVGPGSGIYLPVLAEQAAEVVAADIEDAYLTRLRPLEMDHANLELVNDDITQSAFASAHFDMILCTEVIEHIADSRAALREMHRLLSSTGALILSTPQKYSPLELCGKIAFLPGVIDFVRWVYKEPILETGHINLMTKKTLRSQLQEAGFRIRETEVAGVYLPGLAELFGDRALRWEQALEPRLRRSRLEWLLWTQYIVATPV